MARIPRFFGRIAAIVGLLVPMSIGPAVAEPIAVVFTGRILASADPSIPSDSPFSGSYTIDPDLVTPGPIIPPLYFVQYHNVAPGGGSIEATVNGIPFAYQLQSIAVFDNTMGLCTLVGSGFHCDAWGTDVNAPIGSIIPRVFLEDAGGFRVNSTAFFVNQDLTGWGDSPYAFALWEILDDGQGGENRVIRASGEIHTLPEPGVGLLLAVGSFALAGLRTFKETRSRLR